MEDPGLKPCKCARVTETLTITSAGVLGFYLKTNQWSGKFTGGFCIQGQRLLHRSVIRQMSVIFAPVLTSPLRMQSI